MIMRNNVKNSETKLPPLGINIKFGLRLAGLAVVLVLIYACGATFPAIVVYLGFNLLRLTVRVFRLILSFFFTVISIVILMIIISLLIF